MLFLGMNSTSQWHIFASASQKHAIGRPSMASRPTITHVYRLTDFPIQSQCAPELFRFPTYAKRPMLSVRPDGQFGDTQHGRTAVCSISREARQSHKTASDLRWCSVVRDNTCAQHAVIRPAIYPICLFTSFGETKACFPAIRSTSAAIMSVSFFLNGHEQNEHRIAMHGHKVSISTFQDLPE